MRSPAWSVTGTLTRDPGEDIGSYAITQGSLALSSNYALTYTGAALTIAARAVTITANLEADYSLGEALQFIDETAARVLPSGYSTELNGVSREFKASSGALGLVTTHGFHGSESAPAVSSAYPRRCFAADVA